MLKERYNVYQVMCHLQHVCSKPMSWMLKERSNVYQVMCMLICNMFVVNL